MVRTFFCFLFFNFQKADPELCKSADFNVGKVSVRSYVFVCVVVVAGGAEEEQGWGMRDRKSKEGASE